MAWVGSRSAALANLGLHPTPLRVDKIGRILESDLSSTHISAYRRGVGEAQAVSWHSRKEPHDV